MAAQRVMGERLGKAGVAHVNSLYDMSNAFGSTLASELDGAADFLAAEGEQVFFRQRFANSVCTVQASNGDYTFIIRSGALMGTSEAPRFFLWPFKGAVEEWARDTHDAQLDVTCAMTGEVVDGSLCAFADDLFKKLRVPDDTALAAAAQLRACNAALDARLAPRGFAQNTTKQEVVPALRRHSEQRKMASHGLPGKVLARAPPGWPSCLEPGEQGRARPSHRRRASRLEWDGRLLARALP